ncbi:chymotrypsin-like elastase family member 3B isoform X2 [Acinonyx jubatus]|uniref:Chymotrypsin-like elastase family member 3B isoform X2 n=1 Tax=Acinonyx jubatus TaxID=32536 RepID=A0ABM3NYY9_ACIJB|nr:chymotrypsin-like elastase family member 3B isoform X2 [Acinonyx jubatus]
MMLRLLSSLLLVALASGCGRPSYQPSSRVVNGEDAAPYSWPWQVSLQYEKSGAFHHTCGGSLIAPDWVMTAGHCISSSLTYQVVLGEYNRAEEEGSEQVIPINAGDLFVHPLWNPNCVACGNDIALIKLSRSAQLGGTVQLACLPPAGDILPNGAPCYISGWGRLHTGGPLLGPQPGAPLPFLQEIHNNEALAKLFPDSSQYFHLEFRAIRDCGPEGRRGPPRTSQLGRQSRDWNPGLSTPSTPSVRGNFQGRF